MPILIKEYTWRQTEDTVIVRFPAKDVAHSKVDVFTSSTYIKVHFSPFIFECCLYDEIDEDNSKCSIGKGEVVMELVKQTPFQWPRLDKDVSKREAIQIKMEAIENAQKRSDALKEKKKEKKRLIQKACVSEAMSLDSQERGRIDSVKERLKEQAKEEIEEFKKNQQKQLSIAFSSKEIFIQPIENVQDKLPSKKKTEPKAEVKNDLTVPEPRECGTISVKFTHRSFPTPCRESQLEAENQWLKQQAEARRECGFVVEDLRPEENDPQWLLDKGLSFYSLGNYKGAISAFSHGIKLCNKMPELYIARSSAQLAMGNFRRTIMDTNEAQQLLRPHVNANKDMRFTCHYNCGQALMALGMYKVAAAELDRALDLNPKHKECVKLLNQAEDMADKVSEEELPPKSYINSEDLE